MLKDKFFTADQIRPGSEWMSKVGNMVTVQEVKNGMVSFVCKHGIKWSNDYFNFQCRYVPITE